MWNRLAKICGNWNRVKMAIIIYVICDRNRKEFKIPNKQLIGKLLDLNISIGIYQKLLEKYWNRNRNTTNDSDLKNLQSFSMAVYQASIICWII